MNEPARRHLDPDQIFKMCERKRQYDSRLYAENLLTLLKWVNIHSPEYHVYECPVCHKFHIGH